MTASSAALFLTRLAPGDVSAELGGFARPEDVAAVRARLDLDRSPLAQWALWGGRALRFDFGESFLYGRPVRPLVLRAAANTAILGLTALLVATLIGISLGIVTGRGRPGPATFLVRAFSIACVSLPPLLTSLLLVFVAARTGWFPLGGMTSSVAVDQTWGAWLLDVVRHLPLPVLALALPVAATFERLQAQALGETIDLPFVTAAIARGVRTRDLILRHAWPASLRPLCAVYGLAIGAMLSGSFVVEYVTQWPGLGRLMFDALRARDIYLVAGCAAMGALLVGIGTLAGDLLLAAVDPRVRDAEGA